MHPTKLIRQQVYLNQYDPYKYRTGPALIAKFDTLINLLKSTIGTGVLSMPVTFMHVGLILGVVGSFILSGISIYCIHLLFKSMYYVCKREMVPQITLPELIKLTVKSCPCFIRWVGYCIAYITPLLLFVYQFGVITNYLSFCIFNIETIVNQIATETYSTEYLTFVCLIPFLLMTYVPDMQFIVPLSSVGMILEVVGILCIYYFIYETSLESITKRRVTPIVEYVPHFIGNCLYAITDVPKLLTIERNMAEGQYWGGWLGIINLSLVPAVLVNILTGFLGYWKYGEDTKPSLTLNLEQNHPIVWTIQIVFVLTIYFSYALNVYCGAEPFWLDYLQKYMRTSEYPGFWIAMLKTSYVLTSFCCYLFVPNLSDMTSFACGFTALLLAIIVPPLIDICLRWPDDFGKLYFILFADILLITFGLINLIFEIYSAVLSFI